MTAAAGETDNAIAHATAAIRLAPDDPRPVEQLASVLADDGNADRLASVAEELVSRFPDREDSRYYQAVALMLRGQPSEAAAVTRRLLSTAPNHAKAQNLLGAACATIGDLACARAAFARSIGINSREPSPDVNLGALALQTGDSSAAVRYFREALVVDAESAAARDGLAKALDSVRAQ